jgi:putative Mg2+ transporter-C (MgtC) family protein
MDPPTPDLFLGLPDTGHFVRVLIRLMVACLLGGLIGLERLWDGKAAKVRTQMLVALGAALFTLVPLEGGMTIHDLSRIIQGVATGVGFLGAGTILKSSDTHKVEGLTSAASIWLTAAAGMAVGAGWLWPAILGVVLAWCILSGVRWLDHWVELRNHHAITDQILHAKANPAWSPTMPLGAAANPALRQADADRQPLGGN